MQTIHQQIEECFALPKQDLRTATPLTLAFVGDNVYDLIIRTILYEQGKRKLNSMHKQKSDLVKASAQAELAEYLLGENLLTEEEADYYRKGKSAKPLSHAKNAGITEYRKATGLECLIGYLYLSDREGRAIELCKLGLAGLATKNKAKE